MLKAPSMITYEEKEIPRPDEAELYRHYSTTRRRLFLSVGLVNFIFTF